MNRVNSVQYQISLKDLLSNALNRATANVNTFEQQVNNATADVNRLNAAMSGMGGTSFLKSTGAVALGTMLTDGIKIAGQEAVNQVKSILSAGLDVSKLKAEFGVLAGKETGEALFGDLNKWIGESVFGTEQFANAKLLLSYGINARQIMPDLKMLGDVAMGDAEKMKSLALVFGQTTAAGKLMGGDLNQYIQAGFNPLMEMSRTTGKSFAQLKEEMSDGAISADMVHKAFISATSSGGLFHNMLKDIGDTPFGKLQAMQGNIDMAKAQLGEALLPAMSDFMDATKPLIDALPAMFKELQPVMRDAIGGFAEMAKWIGENGDKVQRLGKFVKLAVEGYAAWKIGTVALTAANYLWVTSIGAQTAATISATTAITGETTAMTAQAESAALLTVEYEALTASVSGLVAAEELLLRQTAANAFSLPIAGLGTGAAMGASTGGAALAGSFASGAARAAIPVAIAYFSGEAINSLVGKLGNTGVDFSIWRLMTSNSTGQLEQLYGIHAAIEHNNYNDKLDEINIELRKNREGQIIDEKALGLTDYRKMFGLINENPFTINKPATSPLNQYIPFTSLAAKNNNAAMLKQPKASAKLQEDISKVTGQQVKNIYVTINGGLVHEFTVKTTNLTESKPEIKRLVTEVLTDAINDSQLNN